MVSSLRAPEPGAEPPSSQVALREDRWLSSCVKHPVITVAVSDDDAAASAVREITTLTSPAMLQARVPASEPAVLAALQGAGMRVVNCAVTLARRKGTGFSNPTGAVQVDVRHADPDRDRAILDVAGRCFLSTRFHLDPQIPDELANRIKREWAANCLRGLRGDSMLVATAGPRLVGFLAIINATAAQQPVRVIDLIGVDVDAQRQGVGSALMARFVDEAPEDAMLRVGTQASNESAMRFYQRLGFGIESIAFDLHQHVGDSFS
jgi:ribosomal protein S18 acetylase RimI-like enzyme